MRRPKDQVTGGEDLFVGVELFSASIPGTWEALHCVLARYPGHPLQAVYEAEYFGFRLS